jgi:hypothetical protein
MRVCVAKEQQGSRAMWSKGEFKAVLEAKALLRQGASNKAEEAALLYARAQGWTEEDGVDAAWAETELNALLDALEPEEWDAMQKAASRIGDAAFRGVVTHAVKRISERNKEDMAALVERSPSLHKPERDRS